jgi:hypothetical protein
MPTHRSSHHTLQQLPEDQPRCPQRTRDLHCTRHNTDEHRHETNRTINTDIKQRVLVRIGKSEPQYLMRGLNVVIGIRVMRNLVRRKEAIHQCFILRQDNRGESVWRGRRAVVVCLTPFLNIILSIQSRLSVSSTHPNPKLVDDPQNLRTHDQCTQYEPRPIRPRCQSCKSPLQSTRKDDSRSL